MTYNFENIFDDKELCFNNFISNHTTDIVNIKTSQTTTSFYKSIFDLLNISFESEALIAIFKDLTQHKIESGIPYGIMLNEITWLQNLMISNVIKKNKTADIVKILELFTDVTNSIAYLYLMEYLERLTASNNFRITSLSDLTEKKLIIHYEAHLTWLTNLVKHIREHDVKNFPELNHTLCEFGQWLHSEGKDIIHNSSKYELLYTMHENLHVFAKKIFNIIQDNKYNILMTYLEKCELISLSIGTELALLDQIIINKKITKDPLTGSLNRHALKSLFESQYELALATNSSFVLAMCDLDYFKNINDTYGHVVGDQMLQLFVQIVKKSIRNSDMIIRYGGEEFLLILPSVDKKNGYKIIEKIRQEFQETSLSYQEHTIKATVSIGMMEIHPENLFKQSFTDEYIMIVDKNLYMAKEAGRNRVEIY